MVSSGVHRPVRRSSERLAAAVEVDSVVSSLSPLSQEEPPSIFGFFLAGCLEPRL